MRPRGCSISAASASTSHCADIPTADSSRCPGGCRWWCRRVDCRAATPAAGFGSATERPSWSAWGLAAWSCRSAPLPIRKSSPVPCTERGPVVTAQSMGDVLRVVGIAGSLRRASYNRALLCAAQQLTPPSLVIEIEVLDDLPMFNADLDGADTPEAVIRLRGAVREADGLLLVTPEYNHGVPGVMKNAIDWLSQPLAQSALDGKPTALMGASSGAAGTARGQSQLRQSFVLTNTPSMLRPEVLVGRAQDKFDATGRLTDEGTRRFVASFLEQFAVWIRREQRAADLE